MVETACEKVKELSLAAKDILALLMMHELSLEGAQEVLSEADRMICRILFEPVEARKKNLLTEYVR